MLTGTMVWCWKCGGYACAWARLLAQLCPGRARGFRKQAWQRLLPGLHPSSRVALGADAVPEPGRPMPASFANAVRGAEASRTREADYCSSRAEIGIPLVTSWLHQGLQLCAVVLLPRRLRLGGALLLVGGLPRSGACVESNLILRGEGSSSSSSLLPLLPALAQLQLLKHRMTSRARW